MSKHLQHFVDNFLKGAMLGSHWVELQQKADDRKEQREIAKEKNRIDRDRWNATNQLNQRRADAYERDINAKIAGVGYYNRAKGGGGGGGGISPEGQAFSADMANAGLNVTPVPDREGPATYQPPAEPDIPTSEPPAPLTYDARGGKIPGPRMRRGGKPNFGTAFAAGMKTGQAAQDKQAGKPAPPSPDVRPVGPQGSGPGGSYQVGDFPSLQPSAGTNGPGSGYGDTAAPPVTAPPTAIDPTVPNYPADSNAFRRGGRVPRMQQGGRVPKFAEGGSWGSLFPERTPAPPSVPDDPQQAIEAREARDVEERAAQIRRQNTINRRNEVRPSGSSDDGGLVDRSYRTGSDAFPQTNRDRMVDSASARRELQNLTRFGQTAARYGTGETGGTPYVPDRPARDVGETGGTPSVERQRPDIDSPDQYYQDDPRTKRADPAYTGGGGPQTMPAVTVTGSRDGGGGGGGNGRQAISTGWKPLRDQTRTEAYDPEKDRRDPDNIHAVDDQGRKVNYAGYMQPTGKPQAQGRERTPASAMTGTEPGMSTNNVAADYASAPVAFAKALGDGKHPQELYSGAGSPDPKSMEALLKVIDPRGEMPTAMRMQHAMKAVHEFYMQQGDTAGADRAAGEIAQFGVQQSRTHGAQAMKALQGGDVGGAVQQLIAGYDWLPNGSHALVQDNQIHIVDKDGKPTMSIPIDPKTIQNLALGMTTGKLGWDVMGYNPQQPQQAQAGPAAPAIQTGPPGAARPAAQPQAAPAGPATPPAATATGQVTAQSTPTGQPNAPAPAAAPRQAINPTLPPTPPQPRAGAAPPPAANQTAQAQKPQEGGQTPAQTTQQEQPKSQDDLEKEYFEKNPRGASPVIDRQTAADPNSREQQELRAASVQARAEYEKGRQAIIDRAIQRKVPIKEWPKLVNPALKEHENQYKERVKEMQSRAKTLDDRQYAQETYDRQTSTKPRELPSSGELAQVQSGINTRADTVAKDPNVAKNTVLEHVKSPEGRQLLNSLALKIWQQNHDLTPEQAMDRALAVTQISPEGKSPYNQGTGKDAFTYKTRQNQRRGYSLEIGRSQDRILVNRDTLNDIHALHGLNWRSYEQTKKKADDTKAEDEKRGKDIFSRGARALYDLYPKLPGGVPVPPF